VSDTYDAGKAKQAIRQHHVIWRRHALERMLERGLSRKVVLAIAETGEMIEDYSADRPVPTVLLFGWVASVRFMLSWRSNQMVKLPSLPPMNRL